MVIEAYKNLGYDYAPVCTWESNLLSFEKGQQDSLASRSQNLGAMISDLKSFESYPWPDAQKGNYKIYNELSEHLTDGMKLLGFSNGGVLENATDIVGFENLCMLYLLDPELTGEIFRNIGDRLIEFYSIIASIDSVGACVVNDDLKLDGKHSFEDAICPVEDAYKRWHKRIAILGGIDMDFLARKTPEEVYQRAIKLLELTSRNGGFTLGSGNSIPNFIPTDNYLSMLRAASDFTQP